MKRSVGFALLVGLLALAGGGWLGARWLWQHDDGDVAAPDAALRAPADRDAERSTPTAAIAEGAREAAASPEARSAPGTRVELHVVDKASRRAIPAARVRAGLSPGPAVRHDAPCWSLETIDGWMDAHGATVDVDAEGVAVLTLPQDGVAVVVGEAPGLWARAQLRADATAEQRLELEPDASVQVRVVDGRGAPCAGVAVALRASREGWFLDRLSRVSDEQGRAELAHVGPRIRDTDDAAPWSIAAAVLTGEPVARRLDLAALPAEPVVLVLPATGSVEVSVLPLPGGPSLDGGEVSLEIRPEPGSGGRPGLRTSNAVSRPLEDGRARFDHVGLGLELSLEASAGESTEPTRLRVRGPAAPGEVRRVELRLGTDHPVLRLRLVDDTGRVLAGEPVRTELEVTTALSRLGSSGEQHTDADGVLFHDLPAGWTDGGTRTLTLLTRAAAEAGAGQAVLDLGRPLPDGLNDLGDVVIARGARLAAGRVEDSSGAPVAGARVAVQVPHEWAGDMPWFELRDELGTGADAQGAFEVRGPADSAMVRLTASAQGYAGEPAEIPVGATGVVLRLRQAGRVEGRLLLDPGLGRDDLAVQLELASPGAGGGAGPGTFASLDADGAFRADPLLPGTYDLFVRTRLAPGELASVEGLVVPEGGPCTDPRLAAIDLRGQVCSLTLELVPPRAGLTVSGVVISSPAGADPGNAREQTRAFIGERVRLTAVAAALDVEILAQGFRRVRLEGVRADTRVELEEGPAVRLRLPPGVPLPEPPRYLRAFVGPEEDFWKLGPMQDAVFGADRELLLHVLQPGRLQVVWTIEERGESSTSTITLGFDDAQTLEVLDRGGEQVFEVAPDPESYAQALARPRGG